MRGKYLISLGLISFVHLFTCTILRPGLVELAVYVLPKHKTIYLLSDVHSSLSDAFNNDANQINEFLECLIKRNSEESLCILVEQPANRWWIPTVLSEVSKMVIDNDIQNTVVKNIEVRCVANGALYILQNKGEIYGEEEFQCGSSSCNLKNITFSSVYAEHESLSEKLKACFNESNQQSIFDTYINEAITYLLEVKEFITKHGVPLDETIIEISKRLMQEQCDDLYNIILNAFCPFVDLYALYKICTLMECHDQFMVIAGGYHTLMLQVMLQEIGATCSFRIGKRSASLEIQNLRLFDRKRVLCAHHSRSRCILV